MPKAPEYPENLSECVLRITLEDRQMMNLAAGTTRMAPTLKVEYWAGEDRAGRDKWKRALPGLLCAVSGVDDPTSADLLEALARIIRQQANRSRTSRPRTG